MNRFSLVRLPTLQAASERVAKAPQTRMFRAGGVDLIDHLKEGLAAPDELIELRALAGETGERMRAVADTGGTWTIGALVTLAQLAAFEDLVPRRRRETPDDVLRAPPDGGAIGAYGLDVRTAREIGDFARAHPGADRAPGHVHAADPLVFQHLAAGTHDEVDGDVLGPRHVPEDPHERVEPVTRLHPHLVLAEIKADPRFAEMTALHGAVICNQPSIVKYLIEQGAEVDAKNRLGWTPLMIAGGLYIANAHKTSPGSAQILSEALSRRSAER